LILRQNGVSNQDEQIKALNIRLGQIKSRLNRLTDAFLDRELERSMFEEKKTSLLEDRKLIEEALTDLCRYRERSLISLEKNLELAGNALLSHQMALPEEKREMLKIITSNRRVNGKKLEIKPSFPFDEVAKRSEKIKCSLQQDIPRTLESILSILTAENPQGQLPDFSSAADCDEDDNGKEIFLTE